MEPNYLHAYKDYYRVRAERYADNANYQHVFDAESNLSDAMQSCNELIEFKDKIGNLNELCASALVKDEHLMEKAFYEKHQEHIRVLAARRILDQIDQCSNTTELITLVMEEMNKNSLEISTDETHREFQGDWFLMDSIEVYENAKVPDKYASEFKTTADEIKAGIIKSNEDTEQEARKFQPDFVMNPALNLEHRHRRLIPYSDEHLQEQLAKYTSLINR
ncbi:MAG: hypothetical protein AB8B56_13255 [Crocinitomicaceae bacterium]